MPLSERDILNSLKQLPIPHRFSLCLLAFLTWGLILFAIFSRPTSERIKRRVAESKSPAHVHKVELAVRVVGLIHAVVVGIGALDILLFRRATAHKDNDLFISNLLAPHTWPSFTAFNQDAVFYACLSTAFFLLDALLCMVLFDTYGLEFLIHALAGLSGSLYCVLFDHGLVYLLFFMTFENSTPFVNIKCILEDYGVTRTSPIYTLNGLMLVFTFTLFRLMLGTPVLIKFMYELNVPPQSVEHGLPMRVLFTLAPASFLVLNTFWGYLLWKGFLRALGILPESKRRVKEN